MIHSDIFFPENSPIVVRDMSSLLLPYISVRLYAVVYFNCYSVHSLYIYVGEWGCGVEGSRLEAWMKSHKSEFAIT